MTKVAKILIVIVIIVLLGVVLGIVGTEEKPETVTDNIAYADFGEGIESNGHELVGEFPMAAAVAANEEQAAERVAQEFIEALTLYQEGEQDLKLLGTYLDEDLGQGCYLVAFEFTGEEGRMEALVYVKGEEARLKNLSII